MGKTVCDVIVEALNDRGVDTVFGLPGDGINGFKVAILAAAGALAAGAGLARARRTR